MKRVESPRFLAFADKHFGSLEQVVYLLQVREVWAGKERGRIERELKTQDGLACITYFFFRPELGILYVLAAHLVRKGEPRYSEAEAVEGHIRDIENGRIGLEFPEGEEA